MGGKGKNGGQNQSGQQPKKRYCTLCPPSRGKPNEVPDGRVACLECIPDFSIRATPTKGASGWSIVVETFRNGLNESCEFVWSVDGSNPVQDKTDSGGSGSGAKGTKIVTAPFAPEDRKAQFSVVGSKAELAGVDLPAEPKQPTPEKVDDSVAPPQYSITASFGRASDGHEVLVQTYRNGHQVACKFAYQISGQPFVSEMTADGSVPSEPRGTKVLQIPASEKKQTVTFHIVGADADQKELLVPATPKVFKRKPHNKRKGFLGNLREGLRGE